VGLRYERKVSNPREITMLFFLLLTQPNRTEPNPPIASTSAHPILCYPISCNVLHRVALRCVPLLHNPLNGVDFGVLPVGNLVVLDGVPVFDVPLQKEKAAQVGH